MGNFIEINLLKPFGVNCLNRGEDGQVKTVYNGGELRTRISSQAIKRTIRDNMSSDSVHTRYIVALLMQKWEKEHPESSGEQKEKMAKAFGLITESKLEKKPNPNHYGYQSDQITAYAESEIIALYRMITENEEYCNSVLSSNFDDVAKKQRNKEIDKAGLDLETAFFGRMTTAGPGMTIPSATHFNHAYSVDVNREEFDYFSAIDTYLRNLGSVESGHLNNASFASNVMYEYMNIDPVQAFQNLTRNLNHFDAEEQKQRRLMAVKMVEDGIAEIIRLFVHKNPTGKQNSMATNPQPCFLVATMVKNGFPCTMDNCFNKAIYANNSHGIAEIASDKMAQYILQDRPKQCYVVDTVLTDSFVKSNMKNIMQLEDKNKIKNISELEELIQEILQQVHELLQEYIEE